MLRLACLIVTVGSTSAFAPSTVERQPPQTTALHSSRVNYVCPDCYGMETQRQSLLDQFNALQNKNGHVVDSSLQEPTPVAVEAPPSAVAVAPPAVVATPPPAPIEPSPQLPAPVFTSVAPAPVLTSLPEPTFAPVAPLMAPAAPPAPVVAPPVVAPPVASAPVAPPVTSATAATTTAWFAPPQTLFAQRNDYLLQAAAAGKSRWGSIEVEKTQYETGLKQALAILDGPSSTTTTTPLTATTLFEQRNQQILEAAAAGKSRWGTLEVEKTKYETGLKHALDTLSVA